MKRLITTVFLFLVFSNFIYSQEWAPMGAKWYYTWIPEPITGNEPREIRTIEVVGDSLILGKQCSVLKATDALVCEGQKFMYSENDSVFYYDADTESFSLLYDFTASAGESWDVPICDKQNFGDPDFDTFTVDVKSIYTTMFDTIELKNFEVDWYQWNGGKNGHIIYEGIGNASRMYMMAPLLTNYERIWNLRCYDSPSTGLINFLGEPCDQIVPTKEGFGETSFLEIYPSPVDVLLKYKISDGIAIGKDRVRVFNFTGEVFYEKENIMSDMEQSLFVSNWPAGIYLLQYLNNNQIIETKRFIVGK